MDLLQSIHALPRIEKIKVMEFIWEELTSQQRIFESPKWHKEALLNTEKRMDNGIEEVFDWDKAKEKLRNQFR